MNNIVMYSLSYETFENGIRIKWDSGTTFVSQVQKSGCLRAFTL